LVKLCHPRSDVNDAARIPDLAERPPYHPLIRISFGQLLLAHFFFGQSERRMA